MGAASQGTHSLETCKILAQKCSPVSQWARTELLQVATPSGGLSYRRIEQGLCAACCRESRCWEPWKQRASYSSGQGPGTRHSTPTAFFPTHWPLSSMRGVVSFTIWLYIVDSNTFVVLFWNQAFRKALLPEIWRGRRDTGTELRATSPRRKR